MGDTNTFIPEGIYALANPSSGITALNMNCECNLFGRKTYFFLLPKYQVLWDLEIISFHVQYSNLYNLDRTFPSRIFPSRIYFLSSENIRRYFLWYRNFMERKALENRKKISTTGKRGVIFYLYVMSS